MHIAPYIDAAAGEISSKSDGDGEGLAFADPYDLKGDVFVAFEQDHRVLRFAAPGAKGTAIAMPPAIKKLRSNSGLEALASLGDGRLVAMAEEGPDGEDEDSPGWVIDTATGAFVSFTVKRNLPYALTDATLLPDGRLLVLERRYSPLTGPGAEMRLFDPKIFTEGATVDGEIVAVLYGGVTVDNMEGVAARKTADGKTAIYIVSDDNFQRPLQRTLLMMFELAE